VEPQPVETPCQPFRGWFRRNLLARVVRQR
jgi:hypothetical protein